MSICINEDQCGSDTEIIYPNLQSCLSVTGVQKKSLVGTHLTTGTTNNQADRIFTEMFGWILEKGPFLRLYLIGSLTDFQINENLNTETLHWKDPLLKTLRTYFSNTPIYAYNAKKTVGVGAAIKITCTGIAIPTIHYLAPKSYTTNIVPIGDKDLHNLKGKINPGLQAPKSFQVNDMVLNEGISYIELPPAKFTPCI